MSVDGPGANSQHMNERMSEQDHLCCIKEKYFKCGDGGRNSHSGEKSDPPLVDFQHSVNR